MFVSKTRLDYQLGLFITSKQFVQLIRLIIITTLFSFHSSVHANINISIDDSFPSKVIALFEAETVTEKALDEIAATEGAKALINKVTQYTEESNEELLKHALKRAAKGETWEKDPYYFWYTKKHNKELSKLIDSISSAESANKNVVERLSSYLPENFKLSTKVILVVGGSSSGWTNNSGNFQLGLDHHINDPIEVIENTMAHEVFHVAQEQLMPDSQGDSAVSADRVDALLAALMMEGTASLFDDFTGIQQEGELLKSTVAKQVKNRERIQSAFLLFETLIFRTAHDADADLGQLYQIGFMSQWDNFAYEVGKVMSEAIIKYDGKQAIGKLLQKGPRHFVGRYLELCEKDPQLTQFTSVFQTLVSTEGGSIREAE
ncbi:DUF5700 domain-containing putative Zn-dependent protease [Kangiella koreensis]|uniref:DUF2268 domain-containing protein n=1 Tax=Kangiella koreensis (strain DSM 16069 / JCM 12317 / KCTC 12182 / SW-125) TaxID=523791 RepID=C7R7S1_KANKD|nr:DUF5700 domain-containing putative Zn-dependent protease [Kangiella koreensis]ACV27604.1 hypothetical protein Kkor_2194 [Kangiella koreensis DSM 16069]